MLMPNTKIKIQEGDSFSGFMEMSDVKTWNGQIQELKGGFNRGYGEVIELPTESPTPLLHCHTPQPPCESMQDVLLLQNRKYA
jgi:hypothetical protein